MSDTSDTFTLSEPIRVGGEEVTELTLRKPTVDMLQGTKLEVTGDGGLVMSADIVMKVFGKLADDNAQQRQANQRR